MKKFSSIFMGILLVLLFSGVAFAEGPTTVTYQAHVSEIGWMDPVANGGTAGTTGRSLGVEALQINDSSLTNGSAIQYRAHVSNIGWQDYVSTGQMAGTTGQAQHMEAIQIRLAGPIAEQYDIYYRTHVSNVGWLGWTNNDQLSGTHSFGLPIEAIEIQMVPKGQAAPGDTNRPNITPDQLLNTVQMHYIACLDGPGWQEDKINGQEAGSTGMNIGLDGISMNTDGLDGGVRYRVNTWSNGWMDWKNAPEAAGIQGRGHYIEGMQAELYGIGASFYDIYYQIHNTDVGWLGWAKNGEQTSTLNSLKRTEAIKVVVLPKGITPEGYDPNATKIYKEEFPRPANTIGRNYIYVSIPRQQLIYYNADNQPVFQTPVVTGQTGSSYSETPTGNYILNSKQTEVNLVGSTYVSHVHFWLPFIGKQYGIHDADGWRENWEYGGRTYQIDGSHGCVNLPYQAVATLFNLCSIGDPVIIQ